jgi:hypothetical protein
LPSKFNLERYTTAPGLPTTHWFQMRLVFRKPLSLVAGQLVQGVMRMTAVGVAQPRFRWMTEL